MTATVAVFRPDDERIEAAVTLLESLGVEPVPDPMLAVEATGAVPRSDAAYVVFTSTTGIGLAAGRGWAPEGQRLAAIGPKTAERAEQAGFTVNIVPEEYTSEGLVAALEDEVQGATVEVARSDHGSEVLLDGLAAAGADVHETVLYRLVRPAEAGTSIDRAIEGNLDAVLFTSSLTVKHFFDAARERGVAAELREVMANVTVGCIGPPTRETAGAAGLECAVVPDDATFDALARAVVDALD
ncbi:uroporphyrinogen-III synthase [Halanaeroarchaeum sulfurireducens]|uniref:Uroporphyrinogen-III synthase n=1 Tax=Halanaeroarchaeum sulfurireducens TaxID=1604004 RepID=A0A0F7PB73_9EURY|nr:uroporphyrinogen-III synthase [Halanaeroarchaeum sulfurireducens]AKH96588.1 uroporphyrinogen-III synthase [Halanaeroarchaeum sulfurireducens]ALG80990.1 uroporphyrinogen-III synthase [Halanaeroarchaeum sulfurireducens]